MTYTYEYTMNYTESLFELAEYLMMLSKRSGMISLSQVRRKSTSVLHIERNVFDYGDIETRFWYHGQEILNDFTMAKSNENSFTVYYSQNNVSYCSTLVDDTMEFSDANIVQDTRINLLGTEELTEEMYEQLQFIHTPELVHSLFVISKMHNDCKMMAYSQNEESGSPSEILAALRKIYD
ncbi:hypothetical protein BZF66_06055 [Salmonella enterica]|nr:hypothetical protein CPT_Munch_059 [Salmonella phage Munch]EAZ2022857.1 hypothetical protein [Salmonella enterica]ECV9083991.1 hypothetical protein [Salmonella enterica subsp. enterica serovar Infantis]MCP0435909.1 hypothetical protein [Salmonella enterica subsp. enterica serovar Mbandaka]EHX8550308.1 hypothetical protein [Salmonella enterica]